MPTYQLAFTDPPANLAERLKPVLVAQGNPVIFVRHSDDNLEFTGGGDSDFMLRSRACQALTDVWPGWQDELVSPPDEPGKRRV